MMGSFDQFFAGVGDIWRGLGLLLRRPSLWPLAAIPFLLNIALFAGLWWLGDHFIGAWLEQKFFSTEGFWWTMLGWLLGVLAWLIFVFLVVFLFVPIASLIATPFNDLLSEKVEKIYAGAAVEDGFTLRGLVKAMMIGLNSSLRLAFYTLCLLLPVLALNFIPVVGPPLAATCSAAITIRFLSLQFTSYSMDRRYYDYRQRTAFLRDYRWRTIGLGTMAFLVMPIPILNALFIPVSAIAGTLLFCDTELRRPAP